jgi:hypothetical protein
MNRVAWTVWIAAAALCHAAVASAQDTLTFSLEEVAEAAHEEGAAQAAGQRSIAESMGELRWGMSKTQLLEMIKKQIRADLDQRVKRETDIVRQDALYQAAKQRYERIQKGFVAFNGDKSGWDISPVADEFRHGSQESMLVVDDEGARDLYFFIHGRLWKWYRELKPGAQRGSTYAQLADSMSAQFGKGRAQGDHHGEGGSALVGLSWNDAQTRLTLLRRGNDNCLVFEELATLERLPMLREQAVARGPKTNTVLEGVFMSDSQREAWRDQQLRK